MFEQITSTLLENSASAYAAYATNLMLEQHPQAGSRSSEAFASWKNLAGVLVEELAVAIDLDAPSLFAAAVNWSRQSFESRGVPQAELKAAVECLHDLLQEELPENARAEIVAPFEAALATFETEVPSFAALDPTRPNHQLALKYIEACLEGDPPKAMALILDAVDAGLAVPTAYLEVLVPAQEQSGQLWHAGDLGIHEEHVVTATTADLVSVLSHRARPTQGTGKSLIGAAVLGNLHGLGIRMVTELFALEGWRGIYLGTAMPAPDLARAARDFKADLVLLSVTLTRQLKFLRPTVQTIREEAPAARILLGGAAFREAPDVWSRVGADGYVAEPTEAVAAGTRLVG